MKSHYTLAAILAAYGFAVPMAHSDSFTDSVIDDLQANGYDYVEVKNGPTQVKAEGIRGDKKIEVIYDRSSGDILKQEFEDAEDDEIGLSGVETSRRDRDFLGDDDRDDEDRDDDDRRDDDDEDRDDDRDDDDERDGDRDEDDRDDDDRNEDDRDDEDRDEDRDEDDDDDDE